MNQYDHLKNKLHDYKVEVDKEKLWKNTSHAIPQRKRRLAIPIILFTALIISAWLMYSASLLPVSDSQLTSNTIPVHAKQFTENLKDLSLTNSNGIKESKPDPIEVLSSKLSRSVSKLISIKTQSGSEYSSSATTPGNNKILNVHENEIENLETSAPLEAGNKSYNSIAKTNKIPQENSASTIVPDDEPFILPVLNDQYASIYQKENDVRNAVRIINGPVAYLMNAVSLIPMQANSVAPTSSHMPNIQPQKDQFLQSFQMVQGVGFSTMKIHSLGPESDLLVAELKEKMRPLEILSTSATASVNLPGNFSLASGLQFTRLSTVIDHTWETTERIPKEGVVSIIIDEQGIPQSITGNTDVTRTTHYHARRFTEHRYIDLTMTVHKRLLHKQRISLNAFLKGNYNLLYYAKGTMPTNSGLVTFTNDDNPFKQNSPFRIGGGIHLDYRLSSHWNFTTHLAFDQLEYQFKNGNGPIQFQHSGFSLGLGMGYVFQ